MTLTPPTASSKRGVMVSGSWRESSMMRSESPGLMAGKVRTDGRNSSAGRNWEGYMVGLIR